MSEQNQILLSVTISILFIVVLAIVVNLKIRLFLESAKQGGEGLDRGSNSGTPLP